MTKEDLDKSAAEVKESDEWLEEIEKENESNILPGFENGQAQNVSQSQNTSQDFNDSNGDNQKKSAMLNIIHMNEGTANGDYLLYINLNNSKYYKTKF